MAARPTGGGPCRGGADTVVGQSGVSCWMGIEGSVKLGYRAELAAIAETAERRRTYEGMVAQAYERATALHNATLFGIDDTIDPAATRWWVASLLRSIRPPLPRAGKKRPAIDAW